METDIAFVLGLVILAFTFPAIVSSFSASRPPRIAALCFILGGGLIVYAVGARPGGYTFAEVPQVIGRVVASYSR